MASKKQKKKSGGGKKRQPPKKKQVPVEEPVVEENPDSDEEMMPIPNLEDIPPPGPDDEMFADFDPDTLSPLEDENVLKKSACRSRIPPDVPTEHELAFFPDLWESPAVVHVFLLMRNTALATWITNPTRECTIADVRDNLKPPFDSDVDMIRRIVGYLSRYGFINFGKYARRTKICRHLPRNQRLVIVIGAGAAGIAAATQLHSFGFDVIILEGRNYIGGRAQTIKKNGELLETGCDAIQNLENSPIATLMHQVQCEAFPTLERLNMFVEGRPADAKRQRLISIMYQNMRGALNWLAHQEEHRGESGRFVSRQRVYENVFNLIERQTLINYYNWAKTLEDLAITREKHFNRLSWLRKTALIAEAKLKVPDVIADELLRRSLKRDIFTLIEKFDAEEDSLCMVDSMLVEHQRKKCAGSVMHPRDFINYNFILGFEEYLYGAPLESVQFSKEAHETKNIGAATRLKGGVSKMLSQVLHRKDIDVRLNHRVREIDYSGDGVALKVELDSGETIRMDCNFVVSTLPIGVLKASIKKNPEAPTFVPELPEKKQEAIRALGTGLITKVILVFEENFWADGCRHNFYTIQPKIGERGYMGMWSSVPGSKVLTTYVVGHYHLHDTPELTLMKRAMVTLKQTFPLCPDYPASYHVTRWELDPMSMCSGSYMGLDTEKHHFDELLEPIESPNGKKRIYFAGEHTLGPWQGTLEGAWLSGCRQAADLANEHIGVGFVNMGNGDEGDNDDDDDDDTQLHPIIPMKKVVRPPPPKPTESAAPKSQPSPAPKKKPAAKTAKPAENASTVAANPNSEKRKSIKKQFFDPTPAIAMRLSRLENADIAGTSGPAPMQYIASHNRVHYNESTGSSAGTSGPAPIEYVAPHNRVQRPELTGNRQKHQSQRTGRGK